jgi:hypothetical protein
VFGAYAEPDRSRHQTVFAGLLGFFLAPLPLTRPMVEAMSALFPPHRRRWRAATR